MSTPEFYVKKKLKASLDKSGAYYFMPVQMGYGAATVDFLVCQNGSFLAIETKAGNNQLTKRQQETMRKIAKAGGACWVVRLDEEGRLMWTPAFQLP